ncbi:Heat shock 70 kDa protein 12A [Triplophysa tibetana]|uniref:Heat shock 70 kDa protein 12A n=1 Tax=Triplophysa tibetana TaxID=1572043 RepID=A0A5A9PCN4_9TELE|nr:Heat shock 70 kDa protein 12A [Triplophysa tibetana]
METFLYIAIDFGTSYSGYAFSFMCDDFQEQIRIPPWGMEQGLKTFKTPTCILFDEEQEFKEFGYDAMKTFTRLMKKEEAKKHYLFEHFKMELYDKQIQRDLMITATCGKKMKAIKVFSESLRFLKDHALNIIGQHTQGRTYIASDVTWILTVPAIWPSAAKQFMREAAVKADLVTESTPEMLIFALEPEAASVFCKTLPSEGFIAEGVCEEKLENQQGSQYMVVDCGGGTVDITVHELLDGGKLKELHAASGNDMGGQSVDKNVISFLKDIFSEEIFEKFQKEYPGEALKLKIEIDRIKSCDGFVSLSCPNSLQDLAQKNRSIESCFNGVTGAEWDDGAIHINQTQLRSFFKNSLSAIENTIKQILKKNDLRIEYILLVGGYAECPILRNFMKKQFGTRHKILCPLEPQVVILKGAIMYGKTPTVIESRISALTYGFATFRSFDETKHKGKRQYINNKGHVYCDVCFDELVRADESVKCDEVRTFVRGPVNNQQKSMRFLFYSTKRQNIKFVDELGVELIGSLSVEMPDTERDLDRQVRLEIKFGSTEMCATATDLDSADRLRPRRPRCGKPDVAGTGTGKPPQQKRLAAAIREGCVHNSWIVTLEVFQQRRGITGIVLQKRDVVLCENPEKLVN